MLRRSEHSYFANSATSIAFCLTPLQALLLSYVAQHSFLSNAAPSIALYQTQLQA